MENNSIPKTLTYDQSTGMYQPSRDLESQSSPNRAPVNTPTTTSLNANRNISTPRSNPSSKGMTKQDFVTNGENIPETLTNTAFLPAYLMENIGNWVRIDMLVGNNMVEVVGELWIVGASYVIVKTLEPNTTVMVDLFSIKMVTIIYDDNLSRLLNR